MTADKSWEALIAAEQDIAKIRAAINQRTDRRELLSTALKSTSPWQRGAALTFLREFSDDASLLLEQLVDLSLSLGWARESMDVLRAARHTIDTGRFKEIVLSALATDDADDYVRLAQLAAEVEEWSTLRAIVKQAMMSNDPDIREVAQQYMDSHGPFLAASAKG